jgi:hypothetical protein
LWWRDRDDTAADQEDDDVVTIPLFALNLEDTTTTNSGATENRNHDSDHPEIGSLMLLFFIYILCANDGEKR